MAKPMKNSRIALSNDPVFNNSYYSFLFFLKFSLLYFGGVFNKTIIPLALVGYEMIIANSALCASLAISYPMHACGIIVNYFPAKYVNVFVLPLSVFISLRC